MPTTFLLFDFGTNEDAAQQARHKLEGWKQAFRLDKRLLYKFDRNEAGAPETPEESGAKGKGKAKGKPKAKEETKAAAVKLIVRLQFSDHEKLSQHRWAERIPAEEHFKSASPKVLWAADAEFSSAAERFDALD